MICAFYMISDSDNPFGIFKHLAIALSVLLRFMDSDPFFGIFILLTILLSVLRFSAADYHFVSSKLSYCVISVRQYM